MISSLQLNNLEKKITMQFLLDKNLFLNQSETDFFSSLTVKNRYFSGVGFLTELNRSEKLKVDVECKSYKWGKLGAKLNSSIDTGYLLYVENGYLHCIEGYTYLENWPKKIEQIEIYAIP